MQYLPTELDDITPDNRKRIRRVMQLHGLVLAPRVHRRHGRPDVGQNPAAGVQPAVVSGVGQMLLALPASSIARPPCARPKDSQCGTPLC